MKISGPNTVPWGTPDFTGASSELSLSTTTLCTRFVNHCMIHSDPIVLEFSNKSLVCDSVEGFGKVKHQEIKLITVIQTSCQVLYCIDELGLAAMQCPKTVLEMHQDFVYVRMVQDAFEHNVLEHFAAHTCERYGPVISCNTSLAFFEDRSYVISKSLSTVSLVPGLGLWPFWHSTSGALFWPHWQRPWCLPLVGMGWRPTGHVVTIFINENTWILIVRDLCLTFADCL